MQLEEKILHVFDDIKFRDRNHQEYFSHSGFSNLGYSPDGSAAGEQAARNLVDKLLSFIPGKSARMLDVACGQGGTTKRLAEVYGAQNVVAINLSGPQLAAAAKIAPGCTFEKMDAAKLTFEDGAFDGVMCVEAAFHFDTRKDFLREALRVLRPGGRLVMTDILFASILPPTVPKVNAIRTRSEYRGALAEQGFTDVVVENAFDVTVRPAVRNVLRFAWKLLMRDGLAQVRPFLLTAIEAAWWRFLFREYLLVSAQKPIARDAAS